MEQGGSFLGAGRIPLAPFWKQLETTLALEPLRSRTAGATWFT